MKPLIHAALVASLATSLTLLAPLAQANDAVAFERAIKLDNDAAVRALLARGFDPNTRTESGNPGLYVALQEGSLKVARLLIDSPRLQAESRNASDESPLMMAALKGQLELARLLIAKGADVNKPGWAPLHYAATGGHLDLIHLLLEHHAFIDAQSPNGTTPLMMAAFYGTPEAVKLLIEQGADIDMRNQKGMTAMDFARQGERSNAIELLNQAERYKAQARTRQAPPAPVGSPSAGPSANPAPTAPAPAAPMPPATTRGQW
ncbi:MAG: ankyrin repeat domain-containing protein [Pseudomonadota bacterium]|nr:ankyrin repeat domain-containing protein [Pseudomonadota bacterium]